MRGRWIGSTNLKGPESYYETGPMTKKEAIQGNSKRSGTRKLIHDLCRVPGDFRRLLCDEFPHLQKQISTEITYDKQINDLLDRETCAEILVKLRRHVEDVYKEGRFKEKHYIELVDEIERISKLPEPQLGTLERNHLRRPKRLKKFLRACLGGVGIIGLWEGARWVWSKINSIKVEGGTIVIAGVAGGGLYISIGSGSCGYNAPHQSSLPAWSMGSMAPSGLNMGQSRRTVNFCVREITVLQEGEPMRPLPQNALDSKQLQQSQQLIYHLNNLLTMYAPMEVPQSFKAEPVPYLGNSQLLNFGRRGRPYSHESAITACTSDQANRLPINLALKWKRKAELPVRNCFPNQNCNDAKMFTISCEFSYSIADQKDEYRCPKQSFSILTNGISFIKPPVLPIEQELQQVQQRQPNTNPTDIEFLTILNQCGGAFSAIALLAACKNP